MIVLTRIATICSVCDKRNKCNHKRMVACIANDMKDFKESDKANKLIDMGITSGKLNDIMNGNISPRVEIIMNSGSYSDANQNIRDTMDEINARIPQNFTTMFLEKMSQQATSLNQPQRRKFGR